jgi:hypothetical protein
VFLFLKRGRRAENVAQVVESLYKAPGSIPRTGKKLFTFSKTTLFGVKSVKFEKCILQFISLTLGLTMLPRLASNSQFSCLSLPSSEDYKGTTQPGAGGSCL